MEISRLSKKGLKIKSKQAVIAVEEFLHSEAVATIFLRDPQRVSFYSEKEGVIIASAGEYEVGGIKIKGYQQQDGGLVFSLLVDGVSVLLGTLSVFEKYHTKLQEHDVLVVDCDITKDPSFLSGLGTHSMLFCNEHAQEVVKLSAKENMQSASKFVATKDKLPQELVTLLLQ